MGKRDKNNNISNITKQGGKMNILDFLKNGSGIHIKKKNKGKFTSFCGGTVTEECIARGKRSSNPTTRKRANFAWVARHKFKHQQGGILGNTTVINSNPDINRVIETQNDPVFKTFAEYLRNKYIEDESNHQESFWNGMFNKVGDLLTNFVTKKANKFNGSPANQAIQQNGVPKTYSGTPTLKAPQMSYTVNKILGLNNNPNPYNMDSIQVNGIWVNKYNTNAINSAMSNGFNNI